MLAQCKYAVRSALSLRLTACLAVIALNAAFAVCGLGGLYGMGGKVTAVTLSALALCGVFTVNVIALVASAKELFSAPNAYHAMLAPVAGWKLLAGRVIPIVVLDLLSYTIAIVGVVLQSFILGDIGPIHWQNNAWDLLLYIIILVLGYTLCVLAVFLFAALRKSIFYRVPAKGLLAACLTGAVLYVLHLTNFLLMPFARVFRFGMTFTLHLSSRPGLGLLLYFIFFAGKLAVLFFATTRLMERKINL